MSGIKFDRERVEELVIDQIGSLLRDSDTYSKAEIEGCQHSANRMEEATTRTINEIMKIIDDCSRGCFNLGGEVMVEVISDELSSVLGHSEEAGSVSVARKLKAASEVGDE